MMPICPLRGFAFFPRLGMKETRKLRGKPEMKLIVAHDERRRASRE